MLRMNVETRVLDCATPRISMRGPLCFSVRQIDAFGQHAHELVEHVDDLGPAALQLLDDLHARDQRAASASRGR